MNAYIKYGLLLILIGLGSLGLHAQRELSLLDAIQLGLQNNYGIRIADLEAEVARNDNHPGTAGMLPSLDFGASGAYFNTTNPASFLQSRTTANLGPNLNWTLFDGFAMFANQKRLALLEEQSEGNAAIVIESAIQAIILAYNNVLIEQEQVEVLEEVLVNSRERLDYETYRKELGASGTFELLQFKDAFLTDSANLITQLLSLRNARRNLNLVMGIEIEQRFELTDALQERFDAFDFAALEQTMLSNNNNLRQQFLTKQIRQQEIRLARAPLYPTLGINAGINYTLGRFQLLNGERSTNSGVFEYTANLTLSFLLYNGGNTRRAIQNAQLNQRIADLQERELKNQLSNDVRVSFDNYQVQRNILAIRQAAADNARTNLELSGDRFQSGLISSLDYRNIQLQFLNAQLLRLQALRDLKETETELIRLRGGLVRTQ